MERSDAYIRHVDLIGKDEFIRLFSSAEDPGDWFSENELKDFSFPAKAGSLAARYLIKKRICDQIGDPIIRKDIEILDDAYGKPEISFGEELKKILERDGIAKIMCSISHSRNFCTGMTIFCLK